MVPVEEKRKLLETIIELSSRPGNETEVQEKVHEMLLRDTTDGKLYKFRSFDRKGNSLDSVCNGTLHCSKPSTFNDPFDCKIGITFNSLYTAKYGLELDFVGDVFNLLSAILKNEINLNERNREEQRLVGRLLENERLVKLVDQCWRAPQTDETIIKILQENILTIAETVESIFTDEFFGEDLRISAQMLPVIMEKLSPEGKLILTNEKASFEDFARANGTENDDDEIGLTMQLSERFNPESSAALKDIIRLLSQKEQAINKVIDNSFLVGCLCTDFKNRLMWSHYAASHTGFCIEYDFSQNQDLSLFPVIYSSERPQIPWKAALDNNKENIDEAMTELMLGLLIKDKEWQYENEWRLLNSVTQISEIKMPPITCIYLGASISKYYRKKILSIAQTRHIPVKQMKLDRGAYDLHAEEINYKYKT